MVEIENRLDKQCSLNHVFMGKYISAEKLFTDKCWRISYKEARVGTPLISLITPHCCACPKPGHGFPMTYFVAFVGGDCSFS